MSREKNSDWRQGGLPEVCDFCVQKNEARRRNTEQCQDDGGKTYFCSKEKFREMCQQQKYYITFLNFRNQDKGVQVTIWMSAKLDVAFFASAGFAGTRSLNTL